MNATREDWTDLKHQATSFAALHHVAEALKLLKLLAQHAQHVALGALHVQQVLAVAHRGLHLQSAHVVVGCFGSLKA